MACWSIGCCHDASCMLYQANAVAKHEIDAKAVSGRESGIASDYVS